MICFVRRHVEHLEEESSKVTEENSARKFDAAAAVAEKVKDGKNAAVPADEN